MSVDQTTTPICLFNIISLNAFDVAQMSFLLLFFWGGGGGGDEP